MRPPLLQDVLLHTLDVQREVPGGQVLAEELKQGEDEVDQRLQLWAKILWSKGLLPVNANL